MRSYKQIRADIVRLEREAEAARTSEAAAVVAKIKAMAREYDLTAADLGLDAPSRAQGAEDAPSTSTARKAASKKSASKKTASKTSRRAGAGVAKYRDPKSGRTWTGFGRAPDWLASAKNRDAFLIDASGAQGAAAGPASDKRPLPKKARQAASKAGGTGPAKAPAKKAGRKTVALVRPVAAEQPAVKGAAAKKRAAAGKSAGRPARKAAFVAREQPPTAASGAPAGDGIE